MSLDTILAQQAGLITRDQALAAGLRRTAIDERVRARRWVPLHPRVYLAAGRPRDGEVRLRAALLWAGDGAHLCGHAAAWWHGMATEPPPTVTVAVGRSRRLRSRHDVTVRRRLLPEPDRAVLRGLAVTGTALTVLEAAVELGDAAPRFLDEALQHVVPFAEVHAAYCRALGTSGSTRAGTLLAAAAQRSRASAHDELLALLRGSGASGWTADLEIAGRRVDVAFPAARVAIVAAGWTEPPHPEPGDVRWPTPTARGWTLLRFPWCAIVERPRAVLAEIARQVAHGMPVAGRACRPDPVRVKTA